MTEGGTSGIVGWSRLRIDSLQQYFQNNIVVSGDYVETPLGAGLGETQAYHLQGEVDLTEFYATSKAHDFFPGKTGQWRDGNLYLGFNENTDQSGNICDPQENHTVNWAGVMFEMNGPFKTRMELHDLRIFIEETSGTAPSITVQPTPRTVCPVSNVQFSVVGAGTAPLSYRWEWDGIPLVDGPGVSGASTALLELSNVLMTSEGSYRCRVFNDFGEDFSQGAYRHVVPSQNCGAISEDS